MLKSIIAKGVTTLSLFLITASTSASDRIISAGSAVTELLIALDKQDQIVAVDITSEVPSENQLPKIGYHRNLSAEGLLALNPTLVIGSNEMGPQNVYGIHVFTKRRTIKVKMRSYIRFLLGELPPNL